MTLQRTTVVIVASFASTLLFTIASPGATARPGFVSTWTNRYPNSQSAANVELGIGTACQLCHEGMLGGNGYNEYGWSLKQLLNGGSSLSEALGLVESLDSDMDSGAHTNLDEINLSTQPGWRTGTSNVIHFDNGSTSAPQAAPAAILGELDPPNTPSSYCDPASGNSVSPGGAQLISLSGYGTASAVFQIQDTPVQPGILYSGTTNPSTPFGCGLRCVGGAVVRYAPVFAATTTFELTIDMSVSSNPRVQWWYRDPANAGACGAAYNLSNALIL